MNALCIIYNLFLLFNHTPAAMLALSQLTANPHPTHKSQAKSLGSSEKVKKIILNFFSYNKDEEI